MDSLYIIYDEIGKCPRRFLLAASDEAAVRDACVLALGEIRVPLRDLTVRKLFDGDYDYNQYPKVDWSKYKFPESNAEALAPLGASPEAINAAFEKQVADIKENEKRMNGGN